MAHALQFWFFVTSVHAFVRVYHLLCARVLPCLSSQVREHLFAGVQYGQPVPFCLQQHRDGPHLQIRNTEGEVCVRSCLSLDGLFRSHLSSCCFLQRKHASHILYVFAQASRGAHHVGRLPGEGLDGVHHLPAFPSHGNVYPGASLRHRTSTLLRA